MELGERVAVLEERVSTLAQQQVFARNATSAVDERVVTLEKTVADEKSREEERATTAVRIAARASSSERRRFALYGLAIALLTVVSPHVHLFGS